MGHCTDAHLSADIADRVVRMILLKRGEALLHGELRLLHNFRCLALAGPRRHRTLALNGRDYLDKLTKWPPPPLRRGT